MKIFKILLILSINLIICNNYASEAQLAYKSFLNIPVYDTEGNVHTALEILNGDIVFHNRDAAQKAGFTFSPDNPFEKNEFVLIERSSGGYSYGMVTDTGVNSRPPYAIDMGFASKRVLNSELLGKGKVILKPDDEKTRINKDLFKAVAFGDVKAVDELLNKGADPNFIYYKSKLLASVDMASELGNLEILNKLLDKGGNIEHRSEKNQTPLMRAIILKKPEIALYLIKKGAEVNISDIYGNTPLHWAAIKGLNDVVKALIERKVDIDKQNTFGNTPLLYTVEEEHLPEAAALLLAYGANPCLKNKKGKFFVQRIQNNEAMLAIWHEFENEKIIKFIEDILIQKEIKAEVIKNIIDNMKEIGKLSKQPKQYWESLFATYELPKDIIENVINSINAEFIRLNCS